MTTLIGAEKATEYSIAMARTIIRHISSCFSLNMSIVHSARPYECTKEFTFFVRFNM